MDGLNALWKQVFFVTALIVLLVWRWIKDRIEMMKRKLSKWRNR